MGRTERHVESRCRRDGIVLAAAEPEAEAPQSVRRTACADAPTDADLVRTEHADRDSAADAVRHGRGELAGGGSGRRCGGDRLAVAFLPGAPGPLVAELEYASAALAVPAAGRRVAGNAVGETVRYRLVLGSGVGRPILKRDSAVPATTAERPLAPEYEQQLLFEYRDAGDAEHDADDGEQRTEQ